MGSQSPFIGPSDKGVMSFFYWVTKQTKSSYTNSPMLPKIPLSGDGMPAFSSPPPPLPLWLVARSLGWIPATKSSASL